MKKRAVALLVVLGVVVLLVAGGGAYFYVKVYRPIGLISAELRATRQPMRDLHQIATTYLQAINPLLRDSTSSKP